MKRRGFIKALAGALTIPFAVKQEVPAEEIEQEGRAPSPANPDDLCLEIQKFHDADLISDETLIDFHNGWNDRGVLVAGAGSEVTLRVPEEAELGCFVGCDDNGNIVPMKSSLTQSIGIVVGGPDDDGFAIVRLLSTHNPFLGELRWGGYPDRPSS
jgi:hypothetical protein